MISINSWGPMRYCLDKNMTQYIFGCNHSNEYPFTGSGSELIFSSDSLIGLNAERYEKEITTLMNPFFR